MTMLRGVKERNTRDVGHEHIDHNEVEEGVIDVDRTRSHSRRKPLTDVFEEEEFSLREEPAEPIHTMDVNQYELIASNATGNSFGNSTPGLLGGSNMSNVSNTYQYDENDIIWTFACPIFLVVFCGLCLRRTVPSSEYHRGAMIRQQAERVWAIQRAKRERQAIPLEKRKQQIEMSLRKMKVVSKCGETGCCILESEEKQEQTAKNTNTEDTDSSNRSAVDTEDIECLQTVLASASSGNPVANITAGDETSSTSSYLSVARSRERDNATSVAGKKCPGSPGKAERRPLLSSGSEDSEDSSIIKQGEEEISPPTTDNNSYDFEDDEDVCPICLDNFEVGDVVMWSRNDHGTCSHAFHEDCLLQWLLEQRENECPTCRACFIDSSSSDGDDNVSTSSETDEETAGDDSIEQIVDTDTDSDVECGISNGIGDNNGETKSNDEMIQSEDDSKECHDESETDVIKEDETNYTFMIVKGSVKRVPS